MAFQKIIHVVNRTLETLEVMDDGIPWKILPGYKLAPVLGDDGEPKTKVDPANKDERIPVMEVVGNGPGGTVLMVPLPYFAAERAKRQNPVMGTEDPLNPNDFETLIAVPDWNEDYDYMEQSDAIERLDRSMLPEQFQKVEIMQARGRRTVTKRKKGGRPKKYVSVGRGAVAGEAIANPSGIRLSE